MKSLAAEDAPGKVAAFIREASGQREVEVSADPSTSTNSPTDWKRSLGLFANAFSTARFT